MAADLPKRLVLRNGKDYYMLRNNGTTVVGRKDDCDMQVKHASVSSRHACIELLQPSHEEPPDEEEEELGRATKVAVALLRDLSSTNGTFADDEQPTGTRVPVEGARLTIGDFIRFGFCPVIYRLEEAPLHADVPVVEEETPAEASQRRRVEQLKFAETSYLGWLSQVRQEYAAVRERAEADGAERMADQPSIEELEATCHSFSQRPLSRCTNGGGGGCSPLSRSSSRLRPESRSALEGLEEEESAEAAPSAAEIEAEAERLAGRSWEVSSVLRAALNSAEALETVRGQLRQALHFVTESLPSLTEVLGDKVCGPAFQVLLARSGRPAPGHAARDRGGAERLDALDAEKVKKLVSDADLLVGLLRVKIEDDGDLALARTVLEDSIRFFEDLEECATWRNISAWELFAEVND